MMSDLFAILGLCFACFLFWQQRRQSEIAKSHVSRKCEQLELQLLSVSFGRHQWRTTDGRWFWHTIYHFEFSALGDDYYQGKLEMRGFRPMKFHLPPHRMM